jgi:uncharacterized protein YjbJ (UPF0337 family)
MGTDLFNGKGLAREREPADIRWVEVSGVPPPTRRPDMGELKDKAKGIANEIAGNAKQTSDDPNTRAEGRAQERKGEAQNLKGAVKGALGDKI